jgi:hypothetical protein
VPNSFSTVSYIVYPKKSEQAKCLHLFPRDSQPKSKRKARRYTPEEWEQQKANVERLYVTENRPLKEDINTLEQQFSVTARYGYI